MSSRVVKKLSSLYTAELSLVKRGANARRYAVTKGMDMNLQEVLQSVLSTEAEGEEALAKTLKSSGMEDDSVQVALAHYRLQNGFKDKVTKEAFEQVAKAAGYEVEKKVEPTKKSEPQRSTKPAGMPPELETVWKSQQEAITQANERAERMERQLELVQKEARKKDYVAKCEREYAHVPGLSADQMADMLLQAETVSKEFAESLEKQWALTAESVKKSGLLQASGSRGPVTTGGSAWEKMQSMAKERVEKSAGKLGGAQALDEVMAENPDLYKSYLEENPAQVGRR